MELKILCFAGAYLAKPKPWPLLALPLTGFYCNIHFMSWETVLSCVKAFLSVENGHSHRNSLQEIVL